MHISEIVIEFRDSASPKPPPIAKPAILPMVVTKPGAVGVYFPGGPSRLSFIQYELALRR